ncbi:type II secretion system F family protein [Novispirillum sp. DQ9]|uniref:type II secretion system F family protein n=1 Tax=Novispirillum sp. DQ9 TaxID=3398612 RepID=UPI003C7C262D
MDGSTLHALIDSATTGGGTPLAVLALVFAAVILGVYGTASLVSTSAGVRRLRRAAGGEAAGLGRDGRLARLLRPLERTLEPADLEARSRLRLRLLRAGYYGPRAVGTYFALRFLMAVGLPIPLIVALPFVSRAVDPAPLLAAAGSLGLIGYILPSFWVNLRGARRAEAIRAGFPDALDLLLVCVEAGLGLDAAISRVGDELAATHPVISEQMRLTSLELRAGQAREDALRNLGQRCGVDEVAAFVTLLVQSQELGTSIGDSLRVYADDMRNARMMKAEERAAKLPVKMAVPLVLFMLPAFLGSLLWPVIIRVIRVVLPVTGG